MVIPAQCTEELKVGPYKVSFDPGPGNFTINASDLHTFTNILGEEVKEYEIHIVENVTGKNIDRTISLIYVNDSSNATINMNSLRSYVYDRLKEIEPLGYSEPELTSRIIDNTPGIIGRSIRPTLSRSAYNAYYTVSNNDGKCLAIVIMGINSTTFNIINTIHVDTGCPNNLNYKN